MGGNLPPMKGKQRTAMPKIDYPPELIEWFRKVGATGGAARAKRLTPAERRASAAKAGKASGAARRAKARAKKKAKG